MDCALWTDRWLAKYAPNENALITAEDNYYTKKMMKTSVQILPSIDAELTDAPKH
jgi:hypothetical protein